jgi:cytoskeletal protein CcmA (bactofilin family)
MFGNRKTSPTIPTPTTPGAPTPENQQQQPPAPRPTGYETVIGINTTLKGDIDGQFDGSIELDGNLMVGEAATIHADISAHNITISGNVFGNVTGNKVQITRTGRVRGDISAAGLNTEDGAFLDGKITMAAHPAANGETNALAVPALNVVPQSGQPPAPSAISDDPLHGDVLDVEVIDEP